MQFNLVGGIVLLDVVVNGEHGQMAFDTGAMKTSLNQNYFRELAGKKTEVTTYNDGLTQSTVVESEATITLVNEYSFRHDVNLLDFDYVEAPLRKLKKDLRFLGTLGIDIIGKSNFTIDYQKKAIQFGERTVLTGSSPIIPFEFEKLPVITVQIQDNFYPFVLDTGASTCVFDSTVFESVDFDQSNDGHLIIPSLTVGDLELKSLESVASDLSVVKDKIGAVGIIGYPLLKDKVYYFDFDCHQLMPIG